MSTYPQTFFRRIRRFSIVFTLAIFLMTLPSVALAKDGGAVRVNYELPAGDAAVTLKLFVEQSGEQVIYLVSKVRGVQTNAVKGEMTAREALERITAGTALGVVQDEKTGALTVKRNDDADKTAAKPEPAGPATSAGATDSTPSQAASTQTYGDTIALAPFAVSASSNVGYGAGTTSSSGRVVQAYIDVPQSVGVITSELMEDFNLMDSRAAMQAAIPGVLMGSEFTNGWVYIRGTLARVLYIDGMPQVGGIYTTVIMPTQFFDRIEIVKGATSAAFGVGEPGGMINYVSKTPQGKTATKVSTSASASGDGSNPGYNVMIDSQGYAGNSGKLQYRLVAVQAEGKTVNYGGIPTSTTGAQLALNYKFDAKTNVQFIVADTKQLVPSSEYQERYYSEAFAEAAGVWPFAGNPHPYVVLPRILDVQDRVQNPGWESAVGRFFRASLAVTHNFSEHTSIRNATVVDQFDGQQHSGWTTMVATPAPNGDVLTSNFLLQWPTWSHSASDTLDFINIHRGPFGITFKTLVGASFSTSNVYQSLGIASPPVTFNPYDPHPININRFIDANQSDAVNGFLVVGAGNTRTRGYGWYVQEDMSFWQDRVVLSGSWRVDYVNILQTFGASIINDTKGWVNTKGTPRVALTIKPKSWLSFYGLYSVHKDPPQTMNKYDVVGKPLPQDLFPGIEYGPQLAFQPTGYTIEGGVKASILNGKITASVAIYHSLNEGTVASGPPRGTYVWPDGSTTTYNTRYVGGPNVHGYEAQITGQLTDRLVFDVRYGSTQGRDIPFVDDYQQLIRPPDSFGLNGKYDFGDLHGNGFFATFGFNWFGRSLAGQDVNLSSMGPGGDPHAYVWMGSQHLIDAGVGYRWGNGRQKISILCTNVENNTVIQTGLVGMVPGIMPGRQVTANYTISF
ncbi:MAG: TonB-dependent receptor [Opitutaceae bacterium]|nr:TonB-dependent receptor [Opitutaceae bacterium]